MTLTPTVRKLIVDARDTAKQTLQRAEEEVRNARLRLQSAETSLIDARAVVAEYGDCLDEQRSADRVDLYV